MALVHFPAIARWLVHEIDVAAEQACDEEASRIVGDRVTVASTILVVERAAQHAVFQSLTPIASGFGSSATERRVVSLLSAPCLPTSMSAFGAVLGTGALALLCVSSAFHDVVESVLSFVTN